MNMVSESDLPGRSPVRCKMLQPARKRQEVAVRRLGQYLKHAEQLHDSSSRPGSDMKCRSGGKVGVTAEACGAASRQLQPARERQEVPIRRRGWSGGRRSTYSRQHIHLWPRLTRQTRDLTHKVMIITSIAKMKAELECNCR